MRAYAAQDDEPASIQLDAMDEREIDQRVEERAEVIAARATRDYAAADTMLDFLDDSEDETEISRRVLREVLQALAMYGLPSQLFTDAERCDRIRGAIEEAYMPIARLAADNERDDIERLYIAEEA